MPGVVVLNRDAPPSRGAPTNTGQSFVAGLAEKGPTDRAVKVTSLGGFVRSFGERQTNSVLYDSIETFFREGGAEAYVSRVVGPAAAPADVALGSAVIITAKSAGEWGNDLRVEVVTATGGFEIVVTDPDGAELERSPVVADKAAAIAWSANSTYVDVTSGGADPLAAATETALTGGSDDRAAVTDDDWGDALDRFIDTYGPGQVWAPGVSTDGVHDALLNHAAANNRVALLDAPDTATVATIVASATAARGNGNAAYGAMFGPSATIPGLVSGSTRTVPYSAVQAGLEARRDKATSPGVAAAGRNFPLRYATGLTHEFSNADREALEAASVNAAKTVYGVIETYLYRSLVDRDADPAYWQFNYARMRMALTAHGQSIGESYYLAQIDGQGIKASAFGGALAGMLMTFYNQGSLYGENPDDAFRVDVGETVNTPETIAAGELRAVISVRLSPHAEMVVIEFVKTPITQAV